MIAALLTLSFLLLAPNSHAALKFNWLGTTNVTISDGESALLFDPFVTRHGLSKLIFARDIDSDKVLAKKWINKAKIKDLQGIFISHSHWDHLLDLNAFAELGAPKVFGTASTKNFALGIGIEKKKIMPPPYSQAAPVGSFKVKAFKAKHAPHILGLNFITGEIKKPLSLPASMWEMKEGGSLSFHIRHQEGNILFHPSAIAAPGADYSKYKSKVAFMGIANRKSVKDQLEKVLRPAGAKIVVPVHHDNLFAPLKKKMDPAFFADLDGWLEDMRRLAPEIKVVLPKVARWTEL